MWGHLAERFEHPKPQRRMLALDGFIRDEATLILTEGRALGGSKRSGYSSVTRPRKMSIRSVGLSPRPCVGLGDSLISIVGTFLIMFSGFGVARFNVPTPLTFIGEGV